MCGTEVQIMPFFDGLESTFVVGVGENGGKKGAELDECNLDLSNLTNSLIEGDVIRPVSGVGN